MTRPRVSIICVTYNQEQYIRQTLDSFIEQQTDFDIEIIVSDDRSTDGTREVIKDYANKHPDIFKTILRNKNIGVWHNFLGAIRAAKGDYIALCEGDDYWTDKSKLQQQVNLLDKHADYSLCFHPVRVFYEDKSKPDYVFPEIAEQQNFNMKELLKRNYIQTNSAVYRRQEYEDMPTDIMPVDWYLHLYHARFGKIGFINKVMADYRRHPGGVWWDSDQNIDKIWLKYGVAHFNLFVAMFNLVKDDNNYRDIIESSIKNMLNTLMKVDAKYNEKLFARAAQSHPEIISRLIIKQQKQIENETKELSKQEEQIKSISEESYNVKSELTNTKEQLRLLRASRVWKLRNTLVKLVGKKPI
jgi:glycosyltransferase involved in cell wall biosynthesis